VKPLVDGGRKGYVTQEEISAALTKLRLPASGESVQEFMNKFAVSNGEQPVCLNLACPCHRRCLTSYPRQPGILHVLICT
jgi:hypothetical protein